MAARRKTRRKRDPKDSLVSRMGRSLLSAVRGRGWQKPGLAILTSLVLASLMADYQTSRAVKLQVGEISDRDVQAWTDFRVPNYALTVQEQHKAEDATRPVFEHDEIVVEELLRRIDKAYDGMRLFWSENVPAPAEGEATDEPAPGGSDPAELGVDPFELEQRVGQFESSLGITLTETDRSTLLSRRFDNGMSDMVMTLVERSARQMIIGDEDMLPVDQDHGIALVRVRGAEREEIALYEFDEIMSLQQARMEVSLLAGNLYADQPGYVRNCAVNIAGSMIRPNLSYNASETLLRREQARLSVGTIFTEFQEKQVIVRKGERITPEHIDAIGEMEKHRSAYKLWLNIFSVALLNLLLICATYLFAARFVSKFATSFREVTVMAVLLALAVLLCRFWEILASAFSERFFTIPEESYYFAIPVAAGAVMVRILMNSETALVFAAVSALACGYVLDMNLVLALYFFIGAVTGAGALANAKERGRVFRAGIITALVGVAFVIVLTIIELSLHGTLLDETGTKPLFDILFAVACGVAVGIIALGLVPVFEWVGFLTDIKLLELASMDHPLMREMVIKAPGTYHHSVMVGSLAEAAAEAISANALLARVGSYFHDIGKTVKTQYYVENQTEGTNVHDRLRPSMSALVIVNHVKEGIELGERFHLPKEILDIIPQHHGTSLIRFFYAKAQESDEAEKSPVKEEDFRYPGPKPQSRESGIVMLADGVEAATRSLRDPTRHNITTRVQSVIQNIVIDGQLDQCPLTLKDLSIIAETFVNVLVGIHHHRIEYPDKDKDKKGKEKGGGSSTKGGGSTPPGGGKSKGGGQSLTLELPPMEDHPELPHPLDKEARAAAEEELRSSRPGTSGERRVEDLALPPDEAAAEDDDDGPKADGR
jgi:cyclic-di-AMP phosphodiesterase PgpH